MLRRPACIPRPLGMYHPALQALARRARILERRLSWALDGHRYAHARLDAPLEHRVKKHQSVLIRRYPGADLRLQENKVDNLKVVIAQLDGILIRPGETLSFCRSVGRPTAARGFKEGMELSRGEARAGIGGGICQASNLIFWLALHSPLTVIERHHHSFDPFPDQGRVLPFASGATVMWPYIDLRLHNPTPHAFQLKLWIDHKCLNGDLRADAWAPYSYTVYEEDHRFEQRAGRWRRRNTLWRRKIDKRTGQTVGAERLFENDAEVKYTPTAADLAERASTSTR